MAEISVPYGLEGMPGTPGTPGARPLALILSRFAIAKPVEPPAIAATVVREVPGGKVCVPIPPQTFPWDQAEADRLLATARAALSHAEAEHRASRMTDARLAACRTWLAVCEAYVRDHESEARRGWDAMQLLRDAARRMAEKANCGT